MLCAPTDCTYDMIRGVGECSETYYYCISTVCRRVKRLSSSRGRSAAAAATWRGDGHSILLHVR